MPGPIGVECLRAGQRARCIENQEKQPLQNPGLDRMYLTEVLGTSRSAPRTFRLNGKVERSHRIDSEEFHRLLEGEVINNANVFAERLQRWEDYCNYDRPHDSLTGQTPYERLKQKV